MREWSEERHKGEGKRKNININDLAPSRSPMRINSFLFQSSFGIDYLSAITSGSVLTGRGQLFKTSSKT